MLVSRKRQKRVCYLAVMGLAALLLYDRPGFDQDVKNLPPEVAAELARSPKPPPSNQVVGINIDRFIGNPLSSSVRVTHDVIFERSILRHGDSYHPGDPGAVLEYWKDLSLGTMLAQTRTPMAQVRDQQFWYVERGWAGWTMGIGIGT
jgi:hypothetical protein